MPSSAVNIVLMVVIALVAIGLSGFFGMQYWEEKANNVDLEKKVTQLQNDVTQLQQGGKVTPVPVAQSQTAGFEKFKSDEEFKVYLAESQSLSGFGFGAARALSVPAMSMELDTSMMGASAPGIGGGGAGRVSETNVQVQGVDEPDIVKTDGKEIYFSPQKEYYFPMRTIPPASSIMAPEGETMIAPNMYNPKTETHALKAFPPDALLKDGAIEHGGDLLLMGNTLVIFATRAVYGYDVADPKNPKEKWTLSFDDNNELVAARLRQGEVYMVTRTRQNYSRPCPVPLFSQGDTKMSIPCIDVYHPTMPVSADVTYAVSKLNVDDGKATPGISFVGSHDAVVYVSHQNIFIAYAYEGDYVRLTYDLLKENSDLFPQQIVDRIGKLMTYDISTGAKLMELNTILQSYMQSLGSDEMLKLENEMENRAKAFMEKRKRDVTKTDVVKVGLDTFAVEAIGTIPGSLLNQFSLDEYEGYVRAATTVGGFFGMGFGGSRDTENDVYVLDDGMKIVGSVQGMGVDERIYSARFVEDKGYLVTFRQTDPFYVLDLRDPANPKMSGELNIPGFSSYLHPISKERVLGVGQEESQVKLSLFDVGNPENPTEKAKYNLSEYWTEVSQTHHAFLLDNKHKIFFMPGGKGGYVFSYENDDLKLEKAVSIVSARRALFLDNYLYIIADQKVVVLNEQNWETVKELSL